AMPGFTSMSWDALGRMTQASVSGGAVDSYAYDAGRLRVWKNNRLFVRGMGGQVMAEDTFDAGAKTFTFSKKYGYFGGRLTGQKEDRLGTVQTGSRFYPYGEESPATSQDTNKFATHFRDANTGLDYARARYYSNEAGRFSSPDPAQTVESGNLYS